MEIPIIVATISTVAIVCFVGICLNNRSSTYSFTDEEFAEAFYDEINKRKEEKTNETN